MKYKIIRWAFGWLVKFIDLFFNYYVHDFDGTRRVVATLKWNPGLWHQGKDQWDARLKLFGWILVGREDLNKLKVQEQSDG